MIQPAREISPAAFARLRVELARLTRVLSNEQMLELADSIHAAIREGRSRRPPGLVSFFYAGLNDNRPVVGRPGGRAAPPSGS